MKKVFPGSKIRLKIDDSEGVYVFSEKVSVKEQGKNPIIIYPVIIYPAKIHKK